MADLEVDFCVVRLNSPLVAAPAEPNLNANNMKKASPTMALTLPMPTNKRLSPLTGHI